MMVTERASCSGLGFQWDWGWGRSRTPPLKRSACLGGPQSGQRGPVLGSAQPGNEFLRTSPHVSCIVDNRRGHCCCSRAQSFPCAGKGALLTWVGAEHGERPAGPPAGHGVGGRTRISPWKVLATRDGLETRESGKSNRRWFGTCVYFSFLSHSSATCIVTQ